MARVRSIHPGAPLDEDVAAMSIHARYAWAYLPCHADREGRLKDSAFTLKAAIFPGDAIDMEAILAELAERQHIIRYQVGGKRYVQIRTFAKYQAPHTRENASTIPPMSGQPGAEHDLGSAQPGAEPAGVSPSPSSPDLDLDPVQSGSSAPRACDPTAGTTEHGGVASIGQADPLTVNGLISVVTAAVRRNRDEIGVYNPGRWSYRSAEQFIASIPPAERTDKTRAEIKARAELYAQCTDDRITKRKWQVEEFCENFALLGRPPPPLRVDSSAIAASKRLAADVIARYGT